MAEALFYHLTQSTLDQALPSLVERSLARGWTVAVQTLTEERRDALDTHLWTYSDATFLAHGTDRDPHPAEQPVLLTTGPQNPNGATVRFVVEGAEAPDLHAYERVVFMFDGHDAAQLETARRQWKDVKAAGLTATYWQQADGGRWERQA